MKLGLFGFIFLTSANLCFADCYQEKIGPDQIYYNFHGRHILLVGWRHLGPSDEKLIANDIKEAYQASLQKKCSKSSNYLNRTMKKKPILLRRSSRVISIIRSFAKKHKIHFYGEELGEKSAKIAKKLLSTMDSQLKKIETLCPNLKKKVEKMRTIHGGPLYHERNKSLKGAKAVPVDDDTLRWKSHDIFSNPDLDFDPDKEPISEFTKKELQKILKNPNDLSKEKIESLVLFEKTKEVQLKLRRTLNAIVKILNYMNKRNEIIIKNSLKEKGNFITVFGEQHLKGFAEELRKSCLKQQPSLLEEDQTDRTDSYN